MTKKEQDALHDRELDSAQSQRMSPYSARTRGVAATRPQAFGVQVANSKVYAAILEAWHHPHGRFRSVIVPTYTHGHGAL